MTSIDSIMSQNPKLTKAVTGYLIKGANITLGLRKIVSDGLGKDLISGIGGKLEPGETNVEALLREVKEEIGVTVTKFKDMGRIIFLFPHKPSWNQEVRIYIVEEWQGVPAEIEKIKPVSEIDGEPLTKDNLPWESMWDDYRYWFLHVLGGKRIDAIYLYDDKGEKVVEEQIEFID